MPLPRRLSCSRANLCHASFQFGRLTATSFDPPHSIVKRDFNDSVSSDYLPKPFKEESLVDKVRAVVKLVQKVG